MKIRITPSWRLATAIGWGILAGLIVFSIGFILLFAAGLGLLIIPPGLLLMGSGMVAYGNVPTSRQLVRWSLIWGTISALILTAISFNLVTSIDALYIFPLFGSFLIIPAAIQYWIVGASVRPKPGQSIFGWLKGGEG